MEDAKKRFLERHPPKSKEELTESMKRQEEAKKQYTQDVAELSKELENFSKILDPIINPATGKAMCWVKRPSREELKKFVPEEALKYKTLEEIPKKLQEKMDESIYEMMAELIEKPKHDAEWWKKGIGGQLHFQTLFQAHLRSIFEQLGFKVENF